MRLSMKMTGFQFALHLLPVLALSSEVKLDSVPPGFSIPSNPAANFLGSNPSEISNPVTARQFESEILNAIDSAGRIRQGFAIQLALWPLILPDGLTLKEYQQPGHYALANTQVSLATGKSSGDSASTDAALGLNVTWMDLGDPFGSEKFTDDLRKKYKACPEPDQPGDTRKNWLCRDSIHAVSKHEWRKRRWNAGGLATSVSLGWKLRHSRADSLDWRGILFLATGSLGLGAWGKALGQLGYEYRNSPVDSLVVNGFRFGSKSVLGGESINAYGEYDGVVNILENKNPFGETDGKISAGIECMVGTNLWISTGLGYGVFGASAKELVSTTNVKWGTATGPKIRK